MARVNGDGENAVGPRGLMVEGFYLGSKPSRSFTVRATGEQAVERPKVGLATDDGEYVISCKDDEDLAATVAGFVKGEIVTVAIIARPPFGASGAVKFVTPAASSGSGGWR